MSDTKYTRQPLLNADSHTAKAIEKNPDQGLYGQRQIEARPSVKRASCEEIIGGQTNSAIVFGRDRSASTGDGAAASGDTQCSSIDIVTGYGSSYKNDKVPELGNPRVESTSIKV